MIPEEHAIELVKEYQHLIESEVSVGFEYCRTAAIKCAIKQVEAELAAFGDDAYVLNHIDALTYLKSLL